METDYDEEEEFYRIVTSTACVILEYYDKYICKMLCMTSIQIGNTWLKEILKGNDSHCRNMFRMEKGFSKGCVMIWKLNMVYVLQEE